MEILLVLLIGAGVLYYLYKRMHQDDVMSSTATTPETKPMDFDNLSQEHKDQVFEFTKSLAADGLTADEQMTIIRRAQEVGIPADRILRVIAQSWDGRPEVGSGVTEDVVFGYFKDVDPALLGRQSVTSVLDADKDGKVTVKDAAATVKKAAGRAKKAADLDGDGRVTVKDIKVAASKAKSAATKTMAKTRKPAKK